MMRRLLAVGVVLMMTRSASAEVRISRDAAGAPYLEVRPTATGIWATNGPPRSATINPNGDQWGDGYPTSASRGGHLLGAWVRGNSEDLVILRAHGERTTSLTTIHAPGATGTPVVTAVGENWLVAWTALGAQPSVSVTMLTSTEDGTPESVLSGRLVSVVILGDAVHLLSHQATTGELQVATYLGLHWPEPLPIPSSFAIIDLRLAMHWPQPIPVPIQPRAGLHFPEPFPIPTTAWSPCIEVRADDALVAWTARDHQVGSIVLDNLGVVDAARFVRGPSGSCTAVLNAASRP